MTGEGRPGKIILGIAVEAPFEALAEALQSLSRLSRSSLTVVPASRRPDCCGDGVTGIAEGSRRFSKSGTPFQHWSRRRRRTDRASTSPSKNGQRGGNFFAFAGLSPCHRPAFDFPRREDRRRRSARRGEREKVRSAK
jgi:hypothetical protein